jgi:hypothetical protein
MLFGDGWQCVARGLRHEVKGCGSGATGAGAGLHVASDACLIMRCKWSDLDSGGSNSVSPCFFTRRMAHSLRCLGPWYVVGFTVCGGSLTCCRALALLFMVRLDLLRAFVRSLRVGPSHLA